MGLTTTRLYRWDDLEAPSLDSSTTGSFYNLCKTCLGGVGIAYGSKEKAGWSIVWDDPLTNTIVFRNRIDVGGSGGYIRVTDNGSFSGGNRVAKWESFEDMTDISTGINPGGWGWIPKGRLTSTTNAAWVIIADERTIYGAIYRNSDIPTGQGDYVGIFYGGDYQTFNLTDFGFGAAATPDENPQTSTENYLRGSINGILLRSNLGTNTPVSTTTFKSTRNDTFAPSPMTMCLIGITNHDSNGAIGSTASIIHNEPLVIFPAYVNSGTKLRGRMRGLFIPISVASTGTQLGDIVSPLNTTSATNLITIFGAIAVNTIGNVSKGHIYVETQKSWDDI